MHRDCKEHMPSNQLLFYLLMSAILVLFFFIIEHSVLMVSIFNYRDITVGNGDSAKNPAILSFFSVTERAHLNAVHAY